MPAQSAIKRDSPDPEKFQSRSVVVAAIEAEQAGVP